jgi:hypothetical protein
MLEQEAGPLAIAPLPTRNRLGLRHVVAHQAHGSRTFGSILRPSPALRKTTLFQRMDETRSATVGHAVAFDVGRVFLPTSCLRALVDNSAAAQ